METHLAKQCPLLYKSFRLHLSPSSFLSLFHSKIIDEDNLYENQHSSDSDFFPIMSHEIVPVDPINVPSMSYSLPNLGQKHDSSKPFDSESVPETLGSGIQRFLRVANLIDSEEPRIAYLCRFYAFEIAYKRDRQASGRGVRQFRTSLLKRLEQDDDISRIRRKETSDVKEVKRVYHTCKEYIIRHGSTFNLDDSDREKLINARIIASVLYEVLKSLTNTADDLQVTESRESIREISEVCVPYNIHLLNKRGLHKTIMHLLDMVSWVKHIIIVLIIILLVWVKLN